MNIKYDVIIAGAGMAGLTCARVLADGGKRVLVIEQRNHIGGNAYDCLDDNGILIHKYGPHIFHTVKDEVYEFLSRFTSFNGYEHTVLANIYGNMLPVPFNLMSLHSVYPKEKADELENKLIEKYGKDGTVSILELMSEKDDELRELGKYVYENIFEKYTIKQWDMKPEDINPATTARVPVRISEDCRYFTDKYQGLPADSYTAMFENMINHNDIDLWLNTDCAEHIALRNGKIFFDGNEFDGDFIYTGKPDDLLSEKYGSLPYRTLDFEFENVDKEYFQPCATVNYTVDMPYTRITEFKHMTYQKANTTTILKEYSKAYTPGTDEIPYYPVINQDSSMLFEKYKTELSEYKNLYLVGRLAEYKYYNMDIVCEKALALSKDVLTKNS